MSLTNIRTAIYEVLDNIAGIGIVHDYERWSADWSRYLDLFTTQIGGIRQVRGWTIGYSGTAESDQVQLDGGELRSSRWVVRGYMGWDDSRETEKDFQDLVEDVLDALDDESTTLHDPADYYDIGPATAPVVEARVFGSVLCHYCEIILTVTEFRA